MQISVAPGIASRSCVLLSAALAPQALVQTIDSSSGVIAQRIVSGRQLLRVGTDCQSKQKIPQQEKSVFV